MVADLRPYLVDMKASQSIGIFDSGIGGLTVARAVLELLPNEDLIYFGDTAHLPYGDKSTAAIQAYSVKIAHFLLEKGVKAILIACNSASAAAYELVKEYVGSRAVVLNVIDPAVSFLALKYPMATVGLIGTRQTVNSAVYSKKLKEQAPNLELKSLATPLLAPMIEEGFFNSAISEGVIHQYLANEELKSIKALILACTHYPLIKQQIEGFYQGGVEVIDSSQMVAYSLRDQLGRLGLLKTGDKVGTRTFYVSDLTDSFEATTELFFSQKVQLELHKLWE